MRVPISSAGSKKTGVFLVSQIVRSFRSLTIDDISLASETVVVLNSEGFNRAMSILNA